MTESAGGFLALKAENDAVRTLNYLMSTQNADGSWPQNMWLEGSQVLAKATVRWSDDNWETKNSTEAKEIIPGIFVADIMTENKNTDKIEFTFHWGESDNWENRNYSVQVKYLSN